MGGNIPVVKEEIVLSPLCQRSVGVTAVYSHLVDILKQVLGCQPNMQGKN